MKRTYKNRKYKKRTNKRRKSVKNNKKNRSNIDLLKLKKCFWTSKKT